MAPYETVSEQLRDTDRYPLTLSEFEIVSMALQSVAQEIARTGEPGWEERCRMYYRIANRFSDYATKHIVA